jgi:hypothetical protein
MEKANFCTVIFVYYMKPMIEKRSFLPEQGGLTPSQYQVGQPIAILSLESKGAN